MSEWFLDQVKKLPKEWKALFALQKKSLIEITEHLDKIVPIPSEDKVLNAFFKTAPSEIKCVIIGQDPYPNHENAHGFSFHTGGKISPSLKNIHVCLKHYNLAMPQDGDLMHWVDQGVFLLNIFLTFGNPKHTFWESFTKQLIGNLDAAYPNIIYMLWGTHAQKLAPQIKNGYVLKWGHPSPISVINNPGNPARFELCDSFMKCNIILSALNKKTINWGDNDTVDSTTLKKHIDKDIVSYLASLNGSLTSHQTNEIFAHLPMQVKEALMAELSKDNENKDEEINNIIDNATIEELIANEKVATPIHPDPQTPRLLKCDRELFAFTDGSASGNGKSHAKAGWGFVVGHSLYDKMDNREKIIHSDYDKVYATPKYKPSNNRGELTAILELLEFLKAYETFTITIYSDSEYSINTICDFYPKWTKEKAATKANIDLLKTIDASLKELESRKCSILFQHVYAHKKEPPQNTEDWYRWYFNDEADKLSRKLQ